MTAIMRKLLVLAKRPPKGQSPLDAKNRLINTILQLNGLSEKLASGQALESTLQTARFL